MEFLFSKLVRLGTPVYVDLLLLALCLPHTGLGYVVQYSPTAMPVLGLYLKEPGTSLIQDLPLTYSLVADKILWVAF